MPTVYAIGAGFGTGSHLTGEAVDALRRCAVVFHTSECAALFESGGGDAVRGWVGRRVDVSDLFEYGSARSSIHERVAGLIVAGARRHGVVAWLTRGHPGLVCGITAKLGAVASDLKLVLVPGLSSVDYCLALFSGLLGSGSFVVCNARDVLSGTIALQHTVAAVILQAPRATTDLHTRDCRPKAEAFLDLSAVLASVYARDHEVHVVEFSSEEWRKPDIVTVAAGDLPRVANCIGPNVSIVVPPAVAAPAPAEAGPPAADADTGRRTSRRWLEMAFESPLDRLLSLLSRTE